MIARLLFLLILTTLVVLASEQPEHLLDTDALWMLVMNTPDAIRLEARGGCPTTEVIPWGKFLALVQLRNGCTTSDSGLVNNYFVNLRTGEIWIGVDNKKYIDSERLRRLRALLRRR